MKWALLIGCVFALNACTDTHKVPDDIIQKAKMEKILWDMVQADRYVNTFILNTRDSTEVKKKEAAVFYERVFQMNGITRDEFIKSYKFYLGRPDITKMMFDSINARASRKLPEVHAPRRNPFLNRRDSLRALDSVRRIDSIRAIDSQKIADTGSTSELSDSALREMLYK